MINFSLQPFFVRKNMERKLGANVRGVQCGFRGRINQKALENNLHFKVVVRYEKQEQP